MAATASLLNLRLRSRLSRLLRTGAHRWRGHAVMPPVEVVTSPRANRDPAVPVRVVITFNEVNNLHGTGALVQRICAGWPNVFSIRARNDYGGVQEFGDWQVRLGQQARTRSEFLQAVSSVLRGRNVETVVCVPFALDDLRTAIAAQECFGAKLCAYVMDEQNIAGQSRRRTAGSVARSVAVSSSTRRRASSSDGSARSRFRRRWASSPHGLTKRSKAQSTGQG